MKRLSVRDPQGNNVTRNGRRALKWLRSSLELAAIVSVFGVAGYVPFIRELTETQVVFFTLAALAVLLSVCFFVPRIRTTTRRYRLASVILFLLCMSAVGVVFYRVVDIHFLNKAPVIEIIVASQQEVRRGETITFEARAKDPDGDSGGLDYNWHPSDGTIEGQGPTIRYTAPAHPTQQFAVITLVVEDSKGKSTNKPFVVEIY